MRNTIYFKQTPLNFRTCAPTFELIEMPIFPSPRLPVVARCGFELSTDPNTWGREGGDWDALQIASNGTKMH